MKKQIIAIGLAAAMAFPSAALMSGCGKQYESDKFTTITWPDSKLANMLPTPESTFGKIETDREDYLEVYIGKTTADQYESYVSSCKEKGFTEKYDSGIDFYDCPYYKAENSDGYRLNLEYHKDDKKSSYHPVKESMYIVLRAPSEEDDEEPATEKPTEKPTEKATEKVTEKPTEKETEKPAESSKADSASFRETMDSYEAFFDEYIAFMQRYKENPSDLTILAEYSEMMSKYLDYMEKLDSIDEDELSDADALYYAEVSARISKKLLDAAL